MLSIYVDKTHSPFYNFQNMKVLQYTVTFTPAEEGGYTVTAPALPGCISEGETYEEALQNIKEAIQAYVESLQKDGLPIPEEISEKVKIPA
ncbi:MAG: type II toxin-antitoxin system HicB family antitoxin [Nitrospirota bacterium]